MMRRLITDAGRSVPYWKDANYGTKPRTSGPAAVFYATAPSGGTLAYQKMAPTREAADKLLDQRLAAPFTADANDYLYQWESSGDYDVSPGLARIKAALLDVNAADGGRNPAATGLLDAAPKRGRNGRVH